MLQEYDGIQRWNSNSDLSSKIRSHHWTNHVIKKFNLFQRVLDFYFFDGQWPATMAIFLFWCLMMMEMLFLTSFRVFHCTFWSPRPCFHITPSFQSVGHSTIPYYHSTSTEPLQYTTLKFKYYIWKARNKQGDRKKKTYIGEPSSTFRFATLRIRTENKTKNHELCNSIFRSIN